MVLSDCERDSLLELLTQNAALNRARYRARGASVDVEPLDFAVSSHMDALVGTYGRFSLVLGSDITYAGLRFHFSSLATVIAGLLASDGVCLLAHEVRLAQGRALAADGGDPALADLRECTDRVGLHWSIVYDDRPRDGFARSGMRCIVKLAAASPPKRA